MLASDLRVGTIFKDGNVPYKVEKYTHSQVARGGATVKVKARNLKTESVCAFSFQGSNQVEDADVTRKTMQYLYKETGYVFMDPHTYEQVTISTEVVGDNAKFLSEGEKVQILYFDNDPVSVDLPTKMVFEVAYTEPGHKGNTVTNTFKDAKLSNGLQVKVPMFTKIGDKVKIDTRTQTYVSKA